VVKDSECADQPTIQFINNSEDAEQFIWDLGDGEISEEFQPIKKYQKTDTFQVTLRAMRSFCDKEFTRQVSSVHTFIPNVITPNNDGDNDAFHIRTDVPVDLQVYSRWGDPVYGSENYQGDFKGDDNYSAGVYYYELEFQDEDKTSCRGWLHLLK